MKILIACEYSGIVRDAFARKGHYAISCDLLDTESDYCSENAGHYQGNVLDIIDRNWDMLIAFPPCTDIAVSGARWFPEKIADGRQQEGKKEANHMPELLMQWQINGDNIIISFLSW